MAVGGRVYYAVADAWSCSQSVYDVFTMWSAVPGRVYQAWVLCPECFEKGRQVEGAQRWMVSI